MTTMCERLAEGNLADPTGDKADWRPHPKFPGVHLKILVDEKTTGGAFSTMMVKIEPGHALLTHSHLEQTEQHFVIFGSGTAQLAGKSVAYDPGSLMVIPKASPHSLTAGGDGMILMALFSPAAA